MFLAYVSERMKAKVHPSTQGTHYAMVSKKFVC